LDDKKNNKILIFIFFPSIATLSFRFKFDGLDGRTHERRPDGTRCRTRLRHRHRRRRRRRRQRPLPTRLRRRWWAPTVSACAVWTNNRHRGRFLPLVSPFKYFVYYYNDNNIIISNFFYKSYSRTIWLYKYIHRRIFVTRWVRPLPARPNDLTADVHLFTVWRTL